MADNQRNNTDVFILSKSKRMWGTYIATALMFAGLVYTESETVQSIFAGGIVGVWMGYLGVETWKKSNH